MAFVSERIEKEEDKVYFNTLGFTDMFHDPLRPYWWAIDREKEIILVPRGGGSFEAPVGYALYIEGAIIEIEANKMTEGRRRSGNIKVNWYIEKIKIPQRLIQKGYKMQQIKHIIEVAFYDFGVYGIERSRVSEVTIQIFTEPEIME